jgi:hypothetical protein
LLAEWLGQELNGARFHCPNGHFDIRVRSQKDHRQRIATVNQPALDLKATKPWQPHVKNDAACHIRTKSGQKFSPVFVQSNIIAHRPQDYVNRNARGQIVIHDMDDLCSKHWHLALPHVHSTLPVSFHHSSSKAQGNCDLTSE